MTYLAANHEAMNAESMTIVGSYMPASTDFKRPASYIFSLSYEPAVKDDPNCGAYRLERLRSILELESTPSVVIYGDSVEELHASAGNDFALKADYSLCLPPVPNSPDLEEMIDGILADFKKSKKP